jgi:predicted DNA binding protein
MAEGIRAEIAVTDPSVCPVGAVAATVESVSEVRRSIGSGDESASVEFTTPTDADVPEGEVVFTTGERQVCRVTSCEESTCACSRIEHHSGPVRDVRVDDGVVFTFIVDDLCPLRDIVADLRDRYDGVTVRRLTRSTDGDGAAQDLVFVDRNELTDRQREVLRTAHEMGYFERPRRSNAGDVSAELGVATATFAEHLAAAQSKLMSALVAE